MSLIDTPFFFILYTTHAFALNQNPNLIGHEVIESYVLSSVFEIREEIRQFLESEGQVDLANLFGDEDFQLKIAYMSDIFSFMNTLNTQMQGGNKFYHDVVDMLDKFQGNLNLTKASLDDGDFSPFPNTQDLIRFQEIQSPNTTFIGDHITSLLDGMSKYFNCPDSLTFD